MYRVDIGTRFGTVINSRPGQTSNGKPAEWWAVDVVLAEGEYVPGLMVVGPTLPLINHRVVVGWFRGNRAHPGWAMHADWFTAFGLAGKELVQEHTALAHYVTRGGAAVWEARPEANPGEGGAQVLELTAAGGRDDHPTVKAAGGANRVARVADYVAVDADSSPAFVAWMTKVTAALNAIRNAPNGDAIPALVSAALGGALALPSDPVPAVDGSEATTGVAVGQVATGSPWLTTR